MLFDHSAALRSLVMEAVILGLSLFGWSQGGESPIYNFGNDASGGIFPISKLVLDSQNNLYGTTIVGGGGSCGGCGTVYEIIPLGAGTWALGNYYQFTGGADGSDPFAPLVLDTAGNIYGTADYGGNNGCGTIFELTPKNNSWIFQVIHTFTFGAPDCAPLGQLVFDKSGNLYGTTSSCVFQLKSTKTGWKYKVIHNFGFKAGLQAGLLIGSDGALYGTSASGGKYPCYNGTHNVGCGFVYQLRLTNGVWKTSTIYNFRGAPNDGSFPSGELIADAAGNLYSTTTYGGNGPCTLDYPGCGTLFELSLSGGKWQEQILHQFIGGNSDGANPQSEPVFDSSGELLGTAFGGGSGGVGVIYKWSPHAPNWTVSSFLGGNDGANPEAALAFDSYGFLYGTTQSGGIYGKGTVFTLLP